MGTFLHSSSGAATAAAARTRPSGPRGAAAAVGAGLLFLASSASAVTPVGAAAGTVRTHEVPADVAVQAYVAAGDSSLVFLVRVPLASLRDVEFPLRGRGYLDLPRLEPLLKDAAVLWIADYVRFYQDGAPLGDERLQAVRVALPGDRSFRSLEEAMAGVLGPSLPASTELVPEQALLDAWFEVPILRGRERRFSIDPRLAHLGVETVSVIHFIAADGRERAFRYEGDPGLVHLDPRWHQAFLSFVRLGVRHILGGIDHLLFLLCLVLPLRRLRPLVRIVTAFTVAHSITLLAAAGGLTPTALWFGPLVETLIAASIVVLALENILGGGSGHRWVLAFAFGLVHGFGFSFALSESLQFAGRHLVTSLLAFNLGVEVGQVLVLLVTVPLLDRLLRAGGRERAGVVVVSALVAHSAWHWMVDRGRALPGYEYTLPAWDGELAVRLLRWGALAAVAVAAAWILSAVFPPAATTTAAIPVDGRAEGVEPHVT